MRMSGKLMTRPFSNFLRIKSRMGARSFLQIFYSSFYITICFGEKSPILAMKENPNVLGWLSVHKEPFSLKNSFQNSFKIFTAYCANGKLKRSTEIDKQVL